MSKNVPPMKREIRDQWTAALESGEYRQATDMLCNRKTGGFCCLGVLTDLAVKAGIGEWRDDDYYEERAFEWDGPDGKRLFESETLPPPVVEWAGLDKNNYTVDIEPVIIAGETCGNLTRVNDKGGTFKMIAKIIKEQY